MYVNFDQITPQLTFGGVYSGAYLVIVSLRFRTYTYADTDIIVNSINIELDPADHHAYCLYDCNIESDKTFVYTPL